MKNLLLIFCVISLCSCTQTFIFEEVPVTFSLNFKFPQGEDMTRGGADLYLKFYNDSIKSKVITPTTYELEFARSNSSEVASFAGEWDADLITLPAGKYTVTGVSRGDYGKPDLTFNEEIEIVSTSSSITLTAQYDCFLVFFNKSQVNQPTYYYSGVMTNSNQPFWEAGEIYYLFLQSGANGKISYSTPDGDRASFDLEKFSWQKSKYYYFDVLSGYFNVPPMDSGF